MNVEFQPQFNNGKLTSFSFWSTGEVVVMQHTQQVYWPPLKYAVGWAQMGAASEHAQPAAFASLADAQAFIEANNLVLFASHEWHEQKPIRVIIPAHKLAGFVYRNSELVTFMKQHEIQFHEEADGVYIYLSFLLPEHRTIFEGDGCLIEE